MTERPLDQKLNIQDRVGRAPAKEWAMKQTGIFWLVEFENGERKYGAGHSADGTAGRAEFN